MNRVLKRLDRTILSKSDFLHFDRLSPSLPFIFVILDTTFYDHAPILFAISFDQAHDRNFPSQFYLNTFFLQQSSMQAHISRIYNLILRPFDSSSWIQQWNNVILRTIKVLHNLGVEFAKRHRCSNQVMRIGLARASRNLEANHFNESTEAFIVILRHKIIKVDLYEAKGTQLRACLNQLNVGDRVSKEFFKCLRPPIHRSQFQAIQFDGIWFTSLPDIMSTFVIYYQKVFAAQSLSHVHQRALDECCVVMPLRLSQAQRDFSYTPLSLDDLKFALSQMANDKAPGIDGFPYEFYKEFWDMVGSNLLQVYKEAMVSGSLGPMLNKGNIKFIPKLGDSKYITSWYPITLLNVSYKIIAKALALKLWPILPLIIRPEQTKFFQGRYILDNVIVVWKGMKWVLSSNQDALFIKIDFEKAYDKIEWFFIIGMLSALGFDPYFISSVKILFGEASVVLTMNDSQSQSISLAWLVRQGCLLAPSLFILAVKAFSYILMHQTSQVLIKGISLPNFSIQLLNGHFANDSFLTLQEDEQPIKHALKCLDTFCLATSSSIQWQKTSCYR